jgi:hypothetical protein
MDVLGMLRGKVPDEVLDKAQTYMDENDGQLPDFLKEHVDNVLDSLPFGLGAKIYESLGWTDPDTVAATEEAPAAEEAQ